LATLGNFVFDTIQLVSGLETVLEQVCVVDGLSSSADLLENVTHVALQAELEV